jgi:hypothetical protein
MGKLTDERCFLSQDGLVVADLPAGIYERTNHTLLVRHGLIVAQLGSCHVDPYFCPETCLFLQI